ncbi:MAG: hypothetical protein NTV52_12635 [Acidobacteria bacterium]|nr:hypothetical protein [Acidobacteriota bacterium]
MPNWKLLAQARGIDLPAEDLERLGPALDSLDAAFAPLRELAPHESEPITIYRLERMK